MGRRLLIRTNEFPYHITARANNKEWFYLPEELCWKIFCKYLAEIQAKFDLNIHAFIMMNNHIHLIVSTPQENIDKAMHYFMMMTSKAIGNTSKRTNRIWGTRYHKCLITNAEYYAHAYKYLYANPIKAGLTESAQDYKWSTFHNEYYQNYDHRLVIQHRPGFNIYVPEDKSQLSIWINQMADFYYADQVRKALRKKEFKFSNEPGVKKYDYFRKFLSKK